MWYIANSPHNKKNMQFVHELENIHNELNYLNLRGNKYKNLKFYLNYYFIKLQIFIIKKCLLDSEFFYFYFMVFLHYMSNLNMIGNIF